MERTPAEIHRMLDRDPDEEPDSIDAGISAEWNHRWGLYGRRDADEWLHKRLRQMMAP